MPAGPASRPWRKFVRFSVRRLILVVFVIGAGLGWIVRQAHIQRDAVAEIMKAGGSVRYDWDWSEGKSIPGGECWAPRWIVDIIGVDYFGQVTVVILYPCSTASEQAIVQVGRLTRLELLFVGPCASDEGLEHLKGLTNLSNLSLDSAQVTDAGLAHLRGLTKLTCLSLPFTRITDAGLVHLKGLANLSTISLSGTRVTAAGAKELQRTLPSLTILR
jgi:internalin A